MYPDYIVDEKIKKKNSKLDQEIQDISNEKKEKKDSLLAEEEINREFPNIKI